MNQRAYLMKCADCGVPIHVPTDAKPHDEFRVCIDCFRNRWVSLGRPSDVLTGEIHMQQDNKRVRWSTPVGN